MYHAPCQEWGVVCGVNLFVGQQVVMAAYRRLAQVTPLRVLGLSASRVRLWGRGMQGAGATLADADSRSA